MSVTVAPRVKTPRTSGFCPNTAGWQFYGFVNKIAGCRFFYPFGLDEDVPRPPGDMTKRQAKEAAVIVRFSYFESKQAPRRLALLAKQAKGLYEEGQVKDLVAQWADFLDECGGYRLL